MGLFPAAGPSSLMLARSTVSSLSLHVNSTGGKAVNIGRDMYAAHKMFLLSAAICHTHS